MSRKQIFLINYILFLNLIAIKEIIIIERALRQIELVSCVKFIQRTMEKDFVEVTVSRFTIFYISYG